MSEPDLDDDEARQPPLIIISVQQQLCSVPPMLRIFYSEAWEQCAVLVCISATCRVRILQASRRGREEKMHKLLSADRQWIAISLMTVWKTRWKHDKAAQTTWTSLARQAEGKRLTLLKLIIVLSCGDAYVQDICHRDTESCVQGAECSSQRQAAQAKAPQACDWESVTGITWRYTGSAVCKHYLIL